MQISASKTKPVTVKVMGPRFLCEKIIGKLEADFYAVKTSPYMENSQDSGVHIYLQIVGVRE